MGKHIFSILVTNKPGVMTRVSSMFTRRGFNIDTLTVGETESPEFSRITVSMIGDDYAKDQVVKQLSKLHDVKQVQVMERDDTVTRELLLVKVKNDSSPDALCIEITGETTKLNAFIELVKPFGIMEICRTGIVALERGSHCLRSSD